MLAAAAADSIIQFASSDRNSDISFWQLLCVDLYEFRICSCCYEN